MSEPRGISGDDLRAVMEGLDSIQEHASAIGDMESCVVVIDTGDGKITARWVDQEWRVTWYGRTDG